MLSRCQYCDQEYEVPEEMRYEIEECQVCGKRFIVDKVKPKPKVNKVKFSRKENAIAILKVLALLIFIYLVTGIIFFFSK